MTSADGRDLRKIGSERLKVLFDIYHVQIMHGDVMPNPEIRAFHRALSPPVFGPQRNRRTQEINYAPIMKAIVETGYTGYVGQEFIGPGQVVS
jgi:hydroxypyruvate isomerase